MTVYPVASVVWVFWADQVPIKEIARRLGIATLASDEPPEYQRAPRGSVADRFETHIRALLTEWPRTPEPVIAERIGWSYSMLPLKKKLAALRPEYAGVDRVDRVVYQPGQVTQFDLWFPEPAIPVGEGRSGCCQSWS